MKKILLAVFTTILSFGAYAQTSGDLYGTWKFSDVPANKTVSAEQVEMAKQMLADMSMTFSANNKYSATLMGNTEVGTWAYDEKTKSINLISSDGRKSTSTIDKLENRKIWLSMENVKVVLEQAGGTE